MRRTTTVETKTSRDKSRVKYGRNMFVRACELLIGFNHSLGKGISKDHKELIGCKLSEAILRTTRGPLEDGLRIFLLRFPDI